MISLKHRVSFLITLSFFFLSGVMNPFLAFLPAAWASSLARTSAFFLSISACFSSSPMLSLLVLGSAMKWPSVWYWWPTQIPVVWPTWCKEEDWCARGARVWLITFCLLSNFSQELKFIGRQQLPVRLSGCQAPGSEARARGQGHSDTRQSGESRGLGSFGFLVPGLLLKHLKWELHLWRVFTLFRQFEMNRYSKQKLLLTNNFYSKYVVNMF